ncbi:MAG: manganese efflux pump MntP family protein [Elusimicrobiota bacterium]
MSFLTTLLIAFGLAMDAFTVSICGGMVMRGARLRDALRVALAFGLFQALMPVAGWIAGRRLADLITAADHWVAFGLLALIGGKMIYDAATKGPERHTMDLRRIGVLLTLSVATSIDALAVGLSFAFLGIGILRPVLTIGAVTAVLSLIGVLAGRRLGHGFERRVGILGGLILVAIGTKILLEHLAAG